MGTLGVVVDLRLEDVEDELDVGMIHSLDYHSSLSCRVEEDAGPIPLRDCFESKRELIFCCNVTKPSQVGDHVLGLYCFGKARIFHARHHRQDFR